MDRFKKHLRLASACALSAALSSLATWFVMMRTASPVVADMPRPATVYRDAAPEVEPPPTAAAIESTEVTVSEPVGYLPPPSLDLTGGKLGNQLVPGTDSIGDVYSVVFHEADHSLYMAVVEPDQARSVWRVTDKGKVERVFLADDELGDISISQDSQGTMYLQCERPARIYRNGGTPKDWKLVLPDAGNFWAMADDGAGTVYGALHEYNKAILFRSTNDGSDWMPWIDFHQVLPQYAKQYSPDDPRFMLRHLHGVIYNRRQKTLLVGTGDVARFTLRSDDDGASWRKVWDEGFTASIPIGGGNRYLLCPDSLHKHPLVIYDLPEDTVKDVWNPKDFGYAGYCYSLAYSEGVYYAAFHTEANEVEAIVPKSGIIASPDGEHWYPFLEWAPLGNHARTNIWLASAPGRVYASVNGALYAFKPLGRDWFWDKEPFGGPVSP